MASMDPYSAIMAMTLLQGMFGGISSAVSGAEAKKQRKFAAEQAALQRTWMEQMANTAHQREVKDLRAAGLNPILSAGGSGATVSGGASASAPSVPDTSQRILDATLAVGNSIISGLTLKKDMELAESQKALNELQGKKTLADTAYQNALTQRQNIENNLYPALLQEQLESSKANREHLKNTIDVAREKNSIDTLKSDRQLDQWRREFDLANRRLDFDIRFAEEKLKMGYADQNKRFFTDLFRGATSFIPMSTVPVK